MSLATIIADAVWTQPTRALSDAPARPGPARSTAEMLADSVWAYATRTLTVTSAAVGLAWDPVPGAAAYRVSVDGVPLSASPGTTRRSVLGVAAGPCRVVVTALSPGGRVLASASTLVRPDGEGDETVVRLSLRPVR